MRIPNRENHSEEGAQPSKRVTVNARWTNVQTLPNANAECGSEPPTWNVQLSTIIDDTEYQLMFYKYIQTILSIITSFI
jgi:hypothetical protein